MVIGFIMATLYAFFALCHFAGATTVKTKCAEIDIQQNFDLHRFKGRWLYRGGYFAVAPYINHGDCRRMSVNLGKNNETFRIVDYALQEFYDKNILIKITTKARILYPAKRAFFTMKEIGLDNYGYELLVLDTDYDSYAILYRCEENGEGHAAFILERGTKPSQATIKKMEESIVKNNLCRWPYSRVNHMGCNENV